MLSRDQLYEYSASQNHGAITAVVVTYADRALMAKETAELAIAAGCSDAVIVDNGANPAVNSLVDGERPDIHVLTSSYNHGSAPAFRAGIEYARDLGAAHVWCLDDDTQPTTSTLVALLDARAQHPQVMPWLVALRPDRPRQIRAATSGTGRRYLPLPGSFMYFDLLERLRPDDAPNGSAIVNPFVELPAAPYGGLLMPLHNLPVLPDPSFVLYEDDTDFTSRAHAAGITILQVNAARLLDRTSNWTAKQSGPARLLAAGPSGRLYYSTRNRVTLDRRAADSARLRLRLVVNAACYLVGMAGAIRNRRSGAAYLCLLEGIDDGLRGVLGVNSKYPLD